MKNCIYYFTFLLLLTATDWVQAQFAFPCSFPPSTSQEEYIVNFGPELQAMDPSDFIVDIANNHKSVFAVTNRGRICIAEWLDPYTPGAVAHYPLVIVPAGADADDEYFTPRSNSIVMDDRVALVARNNIAGPITRRVSVFITREVDGDLRWAGNNNQIIMEPLGPEYVIVDLAMHKVRDNPNQRIIAVAWERFDSNQSGVVFYRLQIEEPGFSWELLREITWECKNMFGIEAIIQSQGQGNNPGELSNNYMFALLSQNGFCGTHQGQKLLSIIGSYDDGATWSTKGNLAVTGDIRNISAWESELILSRNKVPLGNLDIVNSYYKIYPAETYDHTSFIHVGDYKPRELVHCSAQHLGELDIAYTPPVFLGGVLGADGFQFVERFRMNDDPIFRVGRLSESGIGFRTIERLSPSPIPGNTNAPLMSGGGRRAAVAIQSMIYFYWPTGVRHFMEGRTTQTNPIISSSQFEQQVHFNIKNNTLMVNLPPTKTNSPYQLSLHNLSGQVLLRTQGQTKAEERKLDIPLTKALPPGVYIVRFAGSRLTAPVSRKVIVY